MIARAARAAAVVLLAALPAGAQEARSGGLLLRGGIVVDGTGAPAVTADVRMRAGRVVEVAPSLPPGPGEAVLDVGGLVVAPGFVDVHSHVDRQLFALPADSQVAQGITTAVVGVDGGGPYPVGAFLDRLAKAPAALNVAAMVGHGAVRRAVMGDAKRHASAAEILAMRTRVARALAEGAVGLSSGLEYDPGYHASAGELAALAEEAAAAGAVYATHLRDEGDAVLDAMREAMDVGRAARVAVHVSHLKLEGTSRGRAAAALQVLGASGVDATADWYPYSFWVTTTADLAPPRRRGTREHWTRAIADVGGATRVTITTFAADRSYEGRTVADVAAERGVSVEDVMLEIERRGHAGIAAQAMDEQDVEDLLRSPLVMVASDGGIRIAHPRGTSTFPRVLRRYVRERGVLTLEAAIHKMTGMPAARFGLADRGRIAAGLPADVVVFDPAAVADRATAMEPDLAPIGIRHVFVNGVAVVTDGTPTHARPGRALRRRRTDEPPTPRGCRAWPAARPGSRRGDASRRSPADPPA